MKVYISGRISGNEKFYRDDFNWVEEQLKDLKDIEAANPLKYDEKIEEKEWLEFLKMDIDILKNCDAIILINGNQPLHKSTSWKKSYGAKIERLVAKKYGLMIFYGWKHFRKWYEKEYRYSINVRKNNGNK